MKTGYCNCKSQRANGDFKSTYNKVRVDSEGLCFLCGYVALMSNPSEVSFKTPPSDEPSLVSDWHRGQKKKVYTDEFKREIVDLLIKKKYSRKQLASLYDISDGTLTKWKQKYVGR